MQVVSDRKVASKFACTSPHYLRAEHGTLLLPRVTAGSPCRAGGPLVAQHKGHGVLLCALAPSIDDSILTRLTLIAPSIVQRAPHRTPTMHWLAKSRPSARTITRRPGVIASMCVGWAVRFAATTIARAAARFHQSTLTVPSGLSAVNPVPAEHSAAIAEAIIVCCAGCPG